MKWDKKLIGFGVRYRNKRRVSYIVMFWERSFKMNGKPYLRERKITLGKVWLMTKEKAMVEAREIILKNRLAKNSYAVPVYV